MTPAVLERFQDSAARLRLAGRRLGGIASLFAAGLLLVPLSVGAADGALVFAGYDGTAWDVWRSVQGTVTRITDRLEAASPAVASDGRIAFADASGVIWLRGLDGALSAVTGVPTPCGQPTWSPDGRRLAFACFRFHNRQDDGALWIADLEGGTAKMVYDGPGLQKSPAWSPDGDRLAFVSGFRLTPTRVTEGVWTLDLVDGAARALVEGDGSAVNPAWSPDGERLAFASNRSGNFEIWVMSLQSGQVRPLTHHTAYDDDPVWSPDGATIAFQSTRGGELEIWAIPATGGVAQRRVAAGDGGLRSARSPHWPLPE